MTLRAAALAFPFIAVSFTANEALACGDTQTEVYRSTKSVWCVENSILQKYGTFPNEFFAYGDDVVDELVEVFNVPAEGVYTYEAMGETGYAHTGSECCGLGVTVTGDAFYNEGYGATGYWGYLLSLHEMINDWTGQVSSGWPTDFWADHVSAFPNSLDWHIMQRLGEKNGDDNLKKAASAQKARFYPGGDSEDARVAMFDQIFDLPDFGFEGYRRVFSFIEGDDLSWDGLGVPNADVKRTEYVMAYLSLGAGSSLTALMQAAHVGDGSPSGQGDAGYVVSQANIDSIATAHCSIASAKASGADVSADENALRAGNYADVDAQGACGTTCPSECACALAENHCVAPWLGVKPAGSGGTDGSGSAGAPSGGAATGGALTAAGGSSSASGGTTNDVANQEADPEESSGCGCLFVGDAPRSLAPVVGALLSSFVLWRRRARLR